MMSYTSATACLLLAACFLAPAHAATAPAECPTVVHHGTDPKATNEGGLPFGNFKNQSGKKEAIPIIGDAFLPGAGYLIGYTFSKVKIPTGITFQSHLAEWSTKTGVVGHILFNSSVRHTPSDNIVALSFSFPKLATKAGQEYFAWLEIVHVPAGTTDYGLVYVDYKDTKNGLYFEYMDETYYIPKGEVLFSYAVCPASGK